MHEYTVDVEGMRKASSDLTFFRGLINGNPELAKCLTAVDNLFGGLINKEKERVRDEIHDVFLAVGREIAIRQDQHLLTLLSESNKERMTATEIKLRQDNGELTEKNGILHDQIQDRDADNRKLRQEVDQLTAANRRQALKLMAFDQINQKHVNSF